MPEGRAPLQVAIANDFTLVVAGVAALLEPYPDRVRVVEMASRVPVVSEVDLVLYDSFGQAQGHAVDVAQISWDGAAKVVVYSWNLQPELVADSIASGAAGYLSKTLDGQQLVQALEQIHAGAVVISDGPRARGAAAADVQGIHPGLTVGLTEREAEIIALITQGLSNQEIAAQCYLSINSVKTYIRSAYRKIGVQRRAQAVLWGVRHGFEPDARRALADR